MILQFLFQIILLSVWPINALAKASPSLAKPNCPTRCGNVSIPFPFGIGANCCLDDWFAIDCNSSHPTLSSINYLQVLDISLETATIRVNHPVFHFCLHISATRQSANLENSPFVFSHTSNRFTGMGCNSFVSLQSSLSTDNDSITGGCLSICDKTNGSSSSTSDNNCYGIKCCQTRIPSSLKGFSSTIATVNFERDSQHECKSAFLVDQQWFETNLENFQDVQEMTHVPVVLDWGIDRLSLLNLINKSKGYNSTFDCRNSTSITYINDTSSTSVQVAIVQCNCLHGFRGNPYLLQGCQDIDECAKNMNTCGSSMLCENLMGGYSCYSPRAHKISKLNIVILGIFTGFVYFFLIIGTWWLCIVIKKRRELKLKEKFFKQNGGLLLQQQLTSSDGSIDRSKLFNSDELDMATDRFNVNRILGQGGQGTVYKGMLVDGRIVAVKKSKVFDQGMQLEQFINEIVILSQINHRNVVKLLGCCLETEAPLLVYEFIPNGTLFQLLHDQNEELPMTWDTRLCIATEVAGALSYLHSAATLPIYHRDIKSANILLDEKYRAKVADFGTSKSIAIDQTHVTTKVQGTFGYLDPEYFRSSQFTDKSDVYSFGVVLVELLTGQKPVSSTTSTEEVRGLASYFILFMEENRLCDILDAQVRSLGKKEEIMAIATLAKRCLNLNRKKRPTMKEVAMELERIQASQKDGNVQQNYDEAMEPCDFSSISACSSFDSIAQSVDVQPMFRPLVEWFGVDLKP